MRKYKVTCLQCGETDIVSIEENNHQILDFAKQAATNLLAGRWRKDLQWGWQCNCTNDNRLSKLEQSEFDNLVQGDSLSVARIANSLKIPDEKQFRMELV